MLRVRAGNPVEWQGSNCKDTDGDSWFPQRGSAQREAKAQKAICNGEDGVHPSVCPFKNECFEYALAHNETGVWGGTSEYERTKERTRRRREDAELAAIYAAWRPNAHVEIPFVPPHLEIVRTPVPPMTKIERAVAKNNTPTTRRKATGDLARFGDAKKSGALLKDVERHLLSVPQDEDRRLDVIHVSELVKKDCCPRMLYRRIRDVRNGKHVPDPAPRFQLDNIFSEGDRIHGKWQTWFWDMGDLYGLYRCWACMHEWWDTSPEKCAECGARRQVLQYREVPFSDEVHLVVGHADAELRERAMLVEIKSIGAGTIRVEAPRMHAEYTRKYTDADGNERSYLDHDALWRDLHRPFPSHLRQGYMYLAMRKLMEAHGWPPVKRIMFLYEYKPTQATKEFVISGDDEQVAEMLEICKDVVYALDEGIAPACVNGRKRCTACKAYEAKMKEADEEEVPAQRDDAAGTGTGGAASAIRAASSGGRTRIARRRNGAARLRPDGAAGSVHSVGGLLRRASGDGVRG